MKKLKIFILVSAISFFLFLIVKAFENPGQYPPLGGGALQIQSNQLLITKTTKVTGTNNFIVEGGNVGIGTTAPGAKLHVYGGKLAQHESGTFENTSDKWSEIGLPISWGGLSPNTHYGLLIAWDNDYAFLGLRNYGDDRKDVIFGLEQSTDNFRFQVGGSDVMFVGGNSNVGIGTTEPAEKLHVVGGEPVVSNKHYSDYLTAVIEEKDTGLQIIGSDETMGMAHIIMTAATTTGNNKHWIISHFGPYASNRFSIGYKTSSASGFGLSGLSEYLVITTAGNVGIGTTSPAFKLDVAGAAHASSFPVSSDIRFKENIEPLAAKGSILEKLKNLRGVYFDWNDVYKNLKRGDDKRHIGLIAQEVEKEFPELVSQWGDGSDYRALDYSRFTAVLLEGLKELNQKLEELKNKIENGILYVKEIFSHRVTTKEIQLIDKSTNEIYCVWLENGEFQKSKGECK